MIASWQESKWLVLSSLFFLVPSFYAYCKGLYVNSTILLCTSLASVNFWREATFSWRRNVDLVVAKIAFAIFFTQGCCYVVTCRYIGLTGVAAIGYCYYRSQTYHAQNNGLWLRHHLCFHAILTAEMILIIHDTAKTSKRLL